MDGASFSYKITSPALFLSLEANWADGHVFRVLQNGVGCESETAMFAIVTHDVPALDATVMPTTGSVKYSYKTFLSEISNAGTFDPNFYGSGGIFPRALWYRSGLVAALTLANSIDDYWVRDPQLADGIAQQTGLPLSLGGGAIGAMVNLTLNSSTLLTWPNVEAYARQGEIGAEACNAEDTRDSSYHGSWLALASLFDTNGTNKAAYTAALGTSTPSVLSRDQGCIRTAAQGYSGAEIGSFANAFVFNPAIASPNPLTLTGGLKTVTGSGFTNGSAISAGYCYGVDIVTLTVTHGSSAATVASGTLTQQSLIYFFDGAQVGVFEYTVSGIAVQLSGVWTGSSGTFSAMSTLGGPIQSGGQVIGGLGSIWTDNADNLTNNRALEKTWACKYNSPTSLTLFRNWDGPNGSSYFISYYNIGSFGQQPFFTGIKSNQMNWGSKSSNSTIANGYLALLPALGNWYGVYAWDQINSNASFYDTVYADLLGACGSPTDVRAGSFISIHSFEGCGPVGAATGAADQGRTFSAEGGAAMLQYYLASPSPARKAIVDTFYGAIWGNIADCAASVLSTCDGLTASNLLDSDLSGPKWPGFFFGMGGFFANSWPAIRLGNPTPPNTLSTTRRGPPQVRGTARVQ
jgi:hypothetical protein